MGARIDVVLSIVVAASLATGCGADSESTNYVPAATGGGGNTAKTSLFGDTYRVATDQTEAWSLSTDLASARTAAGAYDWQAVSSSVSPGTRIATAAAAAEQTLTGAAAKQSSPTALVAHGISLGKAASTEQERAIAKQYVEKPLLVLSGLVARQALGKGSAESIDSAAVTLFGLEDKLTKRSESAVTDIWGPGTSTITTDALSTRVGQLLMVARSAAAQGDPLSSYHAARARVYVTKYYYASTLNYAHEVEADVIAAKPSDVHQVEGRMFAEGVANALFGAADDDAAPLRSLWAGPAANVTLASVRAALLEAYLLVADDAVSAIGAGGEGAIGAAGVLAGTVDVLAEPLGARGRDPAALVSSAQSIATKLHGGDVAGAKSAALDLEASLAVVK